MERGVCPAQLWNSRSPVLVTPRLRPEPCIGPQDRPWAFPPALCLQQPRSVGFHWVGDAERGRAAHQGGPLLPAHPVALRPLGQRTLQWGPRHVSQGPLNVLKLGRSNGVLVAASMMMWVMPCAWDGGRSGAAPPVPRKREAI